jgi:hypothetical protein
MSVGRRRRIWYNVRPRVRRAASASAVCADVGSNTHQLTPRTAVGSDDVERRLDQLGADRGHLVAVVRVDDDLERMGVVAAGDLGVGDRMVVSGFGREEPGESVESAVDEVEVEVIRQGTSSVGPGGGIEQLAHAWRCRRCPSGA